MTRCLSPRLQSSLLCLSLVLLFAGCQKKASQSDSDSIQAVLSADAGVPVIPCTSTNFLTDYPTKPGEVPPFKFSKQLYADGRVKSINMLSRIYPIYTGFKKHAVELIGTFTYNNGNAFLKGTSEVFEYYVTTTKTAGKKSISKKVINFRFKFNNNGHCLEIIDLANPRGIYETPVIEITYLENPISPTVGQISNILVYENGEYPESGGIFYPTYDKYGNHISFWFPYGGGETYTTYTYDYTQPVGNRNYSFTPSQNLISQEYSLLEVMQWLPKAKHQRKGVAGVFKSPSGTKITQSQVYKNFKFSAKGNLTSVTYADNIPQRTSWNCR